MWPFSRRKKAVAQVEQTTKTETIRRFVAVEDFTVTDSNGAKTHYRRGGVYNLHDGNKELDRAVHKWLREGLVAWTSNVVRVQGEGRVL